MRILLTLALLASGSRALGEEPAAPGPAAEADPGGPPAAGVLTRAPELIAFVPATYPADAADQGIEGAVVLSVVIGEDGAVRGVTVLEPGPHPGFAPAALEAVRSFRFRPAEIDGKPAAVEISHRYEFTLRRPPPTEAPPAAVGVTVRGRLVERGTRAPIAGATLSAGGAVAETDADGRFVLPGLPPGRVTLRIHSTEHESTSFEMTLEDGRGLDLTFRLARRTYDPYEAVVRAEPPRAEPTVRALQVEEVRTLPGTQGDVLKVLQNLPGVARSPFGIGLLVVRGSEPADTNVYLDGIPIPLLFHFGGVTSVVSSDVVDRIAFYPGNFGARYGRAMGGTVDISTRSPGDAFHGTASIDVFDGRAEVEGPLGPGTGFVSLRRSWVDAVLAVALPRVAPDTAHELRVAPRYYDYQARWSAPLAGGTATLLAFGSDDRFEFVRDAERSGRPTFSLATTFHRVGLRHQRAFGAVTNDLVVALGRDELDVLQATNFGILSEIRSLTLRDALRWEVRDGLALEWGADAILRGYDYSVYAPPEDAPGTVHDEAEVPEATVGERAAGTWLSPALYAELDWRIVPRLRAVAGLRVDGDSRLRRRRVWVDPRLSVFLEARPGTTISAAAGFFGEAPQPQETSPRFGNAELAPQRALHLSLGVAQDLPLGLRAEATGFYKRLRSLVAPTREVDEAGELRRLSNGGDGEALGLELLVRRELARGLFGWLSYTLSRSLRQDDPTLPSFPAWYPFALDQTHVLAAVLSWRLRGEWILGTRVRAVSGNPESRVAGRVLDADSGRYRCLPDARPNSGRLPSFVQADARIDKRFVFERWMLSLYLDVQNVTNRENAELRFRSYDCTESVPIPSVPVFPALGLRAEW
jgi:TonB family protein